MLIAQKFQPHYIISLLQKVNALTTWNEQATAGLVAVDADLQSRINQKAAQSALTTEVIRAKAAEQA